MNVVFVATEVLVSMENTATLLTQWTIDTTIKSFGADLTYNVMTMVQLVMMKKLICLEKSSWALMTLNNNNNNKDKDIMDHFKKKKGN